MGGQLHHVRSYHVHAVNFTQVLVNNFKIVSGTKNSGGACSQTLPWPDRFKIASSGPVNTCMCAFVCVQRASSLTKKSQYIRAACALFHYCFT